ncbi:DGQHR domain-containing protein DpdB [Paraliomyxa miuraensis]|uniref:DGQHR domain-containing protein DpdB n=1 Tax=Paraliomyxa miuraensis TaxID=376150 RepID=UPI0022526DF2|nr:DGQHR domain-containing protein DpdB [Paraliomyxa miuraensis]MCX4247533.1 DGQHR domain-containing protein DpdB [Paraliomyxa miuraensis]
MPAEFIAVPAIEVRQSKGKRLYTFAVDGKLVPRFAAVSRIKRTDATHLLGYQRPEVYSHIEEIRNYLETESPMIPNGVVVAFDSSVKFRPAQSKRLSTDYSRMGTLRIPLAENGERRAGFVVDGQQRLAAIREAHVREFPIFVNAFITDDVRTQTEQFILVNSTKPLPKGLLYELLPSTDALLPTQLHRRRLPSELLESLNHDPSSPLFHMVRTPTSPQGVIKDNSMLKMLGNSLSDGSLYRFRDAANGPDTEAMRALLYAFWGAVKQTFPEAWGKSPRHSRLMHGAGIVAVGNLMDHLVAKHPRKRAFERKRFRIHLAKLAPVCAWTEGTWKIPGNPRRWNEIQNTRQDVALLTEHLQRTYDQLTRG